MDYKKITENDLVGKGVVGQPDTPALSALEMQNKVEEIVRDVVIPAFNRLVDAITADMDNRYTKEEVTASIAEKIVQLGAGDMSMGVYDTDGDGIVDKAEKLAQKVKIGNVYFDGTAGVSLEEIGAATSTQGKAVDDLTTDIKYIEYVTSLPSSPNANTLYLIKK
ncbi:MAG: hypothetical protein J6Q18_01220 [Oscillospiraceae bacterium]|nr:hypothetical protein [Oscillospiraceae bacterium]